MGGTTIVQCQSAAARSPDPGMGHSGPMLGLDYLGFEEAAIRSPVLRQPADGLRLEGGPARCGPASAATKQRGRRGGDSGRLIEQRSRPRSFQGRGLLRAYRGAWAEYTNRSPDESTTNRRRKKKLSARSRKMPRFPHIDMVPRSTYGSLYWPRCKTRRRFGLSEQIVNRGIDSEFRLSGTGHRHLPLAKGCSTAEEPRSAASSASVRLSGLVIH